MNLDRYPVVASDSSFVYEFVSEGKNGKVAKVIIYSETHIHNLFNLVLGDKNLETGEIDDTVTTNNGDSRKVLATVASTLYSFTEKFPDVMIFAEGSTRSRTRLYKIGISNHLNLITPYFEVFGLTLKDKWEQFVSTSNYSAFLVKRKRTNFNI